jgi:hypothetical protein
MRYRDEWVLRVAERRRRADEAAIQNAVQQFPAGTLGLQTTAHWKPASDDLFRIYVKGLPDLKAKAIAKARPNWDSGISSDMRNATYEVIALYEGIWSHLARTWFPPGHFGESGPEQYISEAVARQFFWHRAIYQPEGDGTGGTMIGEISAGGVMFDLERMIPETVRALTAMNSVEDIDVDAWEQIWSTSGQLESQAVG